MFFSFIHDTVIAIEVRMTQQTMFFKKHGNIRGKFGALWC